MVTRLKNIKELKSTEKKIRAQKHTFFINQSTNKNSISIKPISPVQSINKLDEDTSLNQLYLEDIVTNKLSFTKLPLLLFLYC